MRIALVQANQKWEDKSANFIHYEKLLSNVNGVDLILLPEMFNTSFSIKPEKLAEEMNNSKSIEWLKKKARKIDFLDGYNISFENWRISLRVSNTEPVVRLNVESKNRPELVSQKVNEIEGLLFDGFDQLLDNNKV